MCVCVCVCTYTCMYARTHIYIYIYIYHSMWTSQTSTRYVWEAELGFPDE